MPRIQCDCALEVLLGLLPFELELVQDPHRRVRLTQDGMVADTRDLCGSVALVFWFVTLV